MGIVNGISAGTNENGQIFLMRFELNVAYDRGIGEDLQFLKFRSLPLCCFILGVETAEKHKYGSEIPRNSAK